MPYHGGCFKEEKIITEKAYPKTGYILPFTGKIYPVLIGYHLSRLYLPQTNFFTIVSTFFPSVYSYLTSSMLFFTM